VTTVWKFVVPIRATPEWVVVAMPARSEIVRVGQQDDLPVVWALVDRDAEELEARVLIAVPTGHDLHGQVAYLGSTEVHGRVVVHVFEDMAPEHTTAPMHWKRQTQEEDHG
jgi:hypothetical protein